MASHRSRFLDVVFRRGWATGNELCAYLQSSTSRELRAMTVAERHSTNGKGGPVHTRLLVDHDRQYYVIVKSPGLTCIVKVQDDDSLDRWLKTMELP